MGKANPDLPVFKVTPLQAVAALDYAGFPADQWATGLAVAEGESGLDTTVVNEIGAHGIWQILKSAHGDLFKALTNPNGWTHPMTNAGMAKKVYDAAHGWSPWEAYTGRDGKGSDGPYRANLPAAQKVVAQYQAAIKGMSPDAKKAFWIKTYAPIQSELVDVQFLSQVAGVADELALGASKTAQLTQGTGAAVVDAVGEIGREMAAFSNFFQSLLLPGTWLRIGSGLVGIMLIVAGMVALGKEASISD